MYYISNMHIAYEFILSLRWSSCIVCLLPLNEAARGFREMSIEIGEID